MELIKLRPKLHILVCVNQRENESCCKNADGEKIYLKLKKFVNANNLSSIVWITKTRCLGFCNDEGTTIVIYPEGIWLKKIKEQDINKIIELIKSKI